MSFFTANPISREQREHTLGQQAHIFWLTGLSGAGKSTLARGLEQRLQQAGKKTILLDGDAMRSGLNRDLGFSDEDRAENIRRAGEVNRLFFEAGLIVVNAFISPFQRDRDNVRALFPQNRFSEIHVHASLDECMRRDPKGLYAKVNRGEISAFTGIQSPYEVPLLPELKIDTTNQTEEESLQAIWTYAERSLARASG